MIRLRPAYRTMLPGLLFAGGMILGAGLLSFAPVQAAIYPSGYKVPDNVTQLAVVRYRGHSKGIFTFYQRGKNKKWKKSFSCAAWIGKNGLGKKKEGDKKTPSGFYRLEQPFGILKNPGMDKSWHYLKVGKRHYWCGACTGKYGRYYNQLVTSKTKVPGEHLIDYKGSYDYAMFITYNKKGTAKKGSAIFLHCSRNSPTAGCVTINKKYMVKLMRKLKPEKDPGILIYQ